MGVDIKLSASMLFWVSFPQALGLASLVPQVVKNLHAMQETWAQSLDWKDLLEKGMGTQLQCSCLENSMDRETWQTTVHGVTKSLTRLNNWHFHLFLHFSQALFYIICKVVTTHNITVRCPWPGPKKAKFHILSLWLDVPHGFFVFLLIFILYWSMVD